MLRGPTVANVTVQVACPVVGSTGWAVHDANATAPFENDTVPNLFDSNTADKLPGFNIGAPYNIGYSPGWWPWYNTWRSWQGKDDFSWSHGRHNLKFGGSYMYTHKWHTSELGRAH